MDFSLDSAFGKISSSFKVDMPDLDVSSSPVKKSRQPKESFKEASADAKPEGKSDRFTFQFDFNEYGVLYDNIVGNLYFPIMSESLFIPFPDWNFYFLIQV